MYNFLVTTNLDSVLRSEYVERQIVMVDGTVPGWKRVPGSDDIHFDHHRSGGPEIQLEDLIGFRGVIKNNAIFVTTQVDADACVAAAYIIAVSNGDIIAGETLRKLRAIAYDCDHLAVPDELSDLADFAAQAVAAMKSNSNELVGLLGLPTDRKVWSTEQKELFASEAFKEGVNDIVKSIAWGCPFPGENGEAKAYWENVEKLTRQIIDEDRIRIYRGCAIFNGTDINEYVDPRCWLKALKQLDINPEHPITVTKRDVVVKGEYKGISYTLGTIPLHPHQKDWDYTKTIFADLTEAELAVGNNESKWGGRATVGGSGWNQPSVLLPTEIISACLLRKPY